MDGILGLIFPRKSKLLRQYIEAFNHGQQEAFCKGHSPSDIGKIIKEIDSLIIDEAEQALMLQLRKDLENKSYPLYFSDN